MLDHYITIPFHQCCRGVVVKHVDSQHRGCEFDSSMCHNKNTIGEEDNGKPLIKSTSLEKTQSPVSEFYYARNRAPLPHAVRFLFANYMTLMESYSFAIIHRDSITTFF